MTHSKNSLYLYLIIFFFSPDIFILDDPTSSLDNTVSEMIFREITSGEHWKEKTIIFSTNNLRMLKFVTKVIFIENGRILYYESPESIKTRQEFLQISLDKETKEKKVKKILKF